ncbi:16122_t:CDS:2 [Funneliformis caledonium]|uniref:16122_t:CDS:1 n=1 Tax=Funneliformis caledonium TaxID=1117310 RepID=A0A9N8ZF42_9GLOM|nr:16122_t:CDS:2 [Funneliformis caledonium]
MYKVYQYQMVLMHAIFIIVGGWAYYTWLKEVTMFNVTAKSFGIEKKYSVWPVYIPDQIIYLLSLGFILRAIREELRWIMNILLLINILEIGSILYRLIVWCPDDLLNSNEFGRCKFKNRIKYVTDYTIIFIVVRYVEIPPEYNYNDDIPRRRKDVIGRLADRSDFNFRYPPFSGENLSNLPW